MHDNKKAVVVRRLGKPASRVSQMNLQRVRVLNNKQNDFSLWTCTTSKKKDCETCLISVQ
jgi:hypothetical protein